MSCRLCQEDTDLMRSHIIPEFMYKSLYDEKNRFHVLTNHPRKRKLIEQKGIREKLLCQNCKTHISQWERYASLVFSGRANVVSKNEGKLIHISGIKYTPFKLFALSVLWRAGVSSLKDFEQVSLGPHAEKIRMMLQDGNPGPPSVYPFIISPVVHEKEVVRDFIMQPTWAKLENHRVYRFVFGGL